MHWLEYTNLVMIMAAADCQCHTANDTFLISTHEVKYILLSSVCWEGGGEVFVCMTLCICMVVEVSLCVTVFVTLYGEKMCVCVTDTVCLCEQEKTVLKGHNYLSRLDSDSYVPLQQKTVLKGNNYLS